MNPLPTATRGFNVEVFAELPTNAPSTQNAWFPTTIW